MVVRWYHTLVDISNRSQPFPVWYHSMNVMCMPLYNAFKPIYVVIECDDVIFSTSVDYHHPPRHVIEWYYMSLHISDHFRFGTTLAT
jgi:hypothetical protein